MGTGALVNTLKLMVIYHQSQIHSRQLWRIKGNSISNLLNSKINAHAHQSSIGMMWTSINSVIVKTSNTSLPPLNNENFEKHRLGCLRWNQCSATWQWLPPHPNKPLQILSTRRLFQMHLRCNRKPCKTPRLRQVSRLWLNLLWHQETLQWGISP